MITGLTIAAFIIVVLVGYKLSDWLQSRKVKEPHAKAAAFVVVSIVLIGLLNGSLVWHDDGEDCYGSGITSTC